MPEDFGERGRGGNGRAHVAFTSTGAVELRVDPGDHQVIVSRGYEFELHTEPVTVAAGETAHVSAALDHVVDTTGVMCADYHIHTFRSPDSEDDAHLKVLGMIADGLEIPIRSDHQWINDFQPLIEEMGLSQFAFGISGDELTTFQYGHFGVFPVTEDRTQPNGSAFPWVGLLPPALFTNVRARSEQPALIINHPRSGGALMGYFNAAGYDTTTASPSRTDYWDEAFTLVEVFNDSDFESNRDSTVADWFSLINSGRRVFAVGSSDSHHIYTSPVGYPRTCLALGTDDPTTLTPNMVRDVTAAGHSFVSGGLFLDVVGPDGSHPGDEVNGVGDTAMFEVTVQAPSWVRDVNRLEVIVDGTTTETIPITESDMGEGAIRVPRDGDHRAGSGRGLVGRLPRGGGPGEQSRAGPSGASGLRDEQPGLPEPLTRPRTRETGAPSRERPLPPSVWTPTSRSSSGPPCRRDGRRRRTAPRSASRARLPLPSAWCPRRAPSSRSWRPCRSR